VSDEIWSWWQPGSVHAAPWPTEAEVLEPIGDRNADAYGLYLRTTEVLAAIRKKKSERTLSAGAQLDRVVIRHNENLEQRLSPVLSDLRAAVRADALEFMDDTMFDVEITPKLQERGA
jgi:valyl-tRNA synthetase